ncbi:cytochrome B [Pandoraea capi]|uniref:Cytochrome B n=1 Tax=Pandoraea capi TaxID=2508286 RepID=A0ABY6W9T3_9BURK|nr:cytochrome b [Pandoraea capi]VVE44252.1 cytochrome B [Pandoraea capi]
MTRAHRHFSPLQRWLHWSMAVAMLAMLFIGVIMVSTLSQAHTLLIALHRPLGILILALVLVRIIVRVTRGSPPLPDSVPSLQQTAAKASHILLYALMLIMPLIGWAMVSAGGYPVTLFGAYHLPPLVSTDARLFALLRALHTWLAFALFALVIGHLAAALMHGLIRRDGVFSSMARGR